MSRTRVAPIKKVSLPRLELLSSLLCARMAEYVRAALGVEGTKITCYTDSTASLWWIKGDPLRFKTFVANRVSEIQTLVPQDNGNITQVFITQRTLLQEVFEDMS